MPSSFIDYFFIELKMIKQVPSYVKPEAKTNTAD
jgi:hypothetical protein